MSTKSQEIWEELKSVLSGKTFDALLPPIIYAVVNAIFGLVPAVITAIGVAILIGLIRILRKQAWYYAFGGLVAVGIAAGLALFTRNAANYFIPTIVSSGLLLVLAFVSILINKPLAAWASHLTRGWPLDWFWRSDVKPAYREVTWMWLLFISGRLIIQGMLILVIVGVYSRRSKN